MDWSLYDGVLFDLDGVLTDTASLHAIAWKRTFDGFLQRRFEDGIRSFDVQADYLNYVDGKPRYQGVASFLASRGIDLPYGQPEDLPGDDTVCAVGNLKNDLVNEILTQDGVTPYPGSVRLVQQLKEAGFPMGVVTSSANAVGVLTAAGLSDMFDVLVDGTVAAELGLHGKPSPDPFLEGARRLGVTPAATVVIEDAVSGVAAGRAGGFGLVIGVARHGNHHDLITAGAGLVVEDLDELT